jgi:hypothetical protein
LDDHAGYDAGYEDKPGPGGAGPVMNY